MKATIEQVDLLKSRANVGYKEAKEALELFDGDLVDALAYLEEQNKTNPGFDRQQAHFGGHRGSHGHHGFVPNQQQRENAERFKKVVKNLVRKGNQTFLNVSKNDATIVNIPLTFAIPLALIATPLTIVGLAVSLVSGCKLRLKGKAGDDLAVNNHIEKVTNIVKNATQKFEQELSK